MPFNLLKYGFGDKYYAAEEHFTPRETKLKSSYDVVIIGGGGHAAAIAYYLTKEHGINDIAILEKGYLGGGNTARNTAVLRANYLTEEGITFYRDSMRLYHNLSDEFGYNILWENRGQLTLAHSDGAIRSFRWRAEMNKEFGVQSEVIDLKEIKELVPLLRVSDDVRFPILAGLWHKDGGTARHDAVVWGFAKGACERGAEIHQLTEVTGLDVEGDKVVSVKTNRGDIKCGKVIQAVAGNSSDVARMAGIDLPIHTFPLQAMVTQPYKPLISPLVSSPHLHVYIQQTSRGEMVIGGGSDPYPLYSTRSSLELKEALSAATIELFPFFKELNILRQWAGITDMTPDYSPIMGRSPLSNYYLDAGWGTWGFKATPISGKTMAELIATDKVPDLMAPFALSRFDDFTQVSEAGATAASH
jgi:sarcosine oxidase subunit beta